MTIEHIKIKQNSYSGDTIKVQLQNAYLQGIKDAVEILKTTDLKTLEKYIDENS